MAAHGAQSYGVWNIYHAIGQAGGGDTEFARGEGGINFDDRLEDDLARIARGVNRFCGIKVEQQDGGFAGGNFKTLDELQFARWQFGVNRLPPSYVTVTLVTSMRIWP